MNYFIVVSLKSLLLRLHYNYVNVDKYYYPVTIVLIIQLHPLIIK